MGQSKAHLSLWLCKCSCGNEKVLPSSSLRSKKIKSCGCLRRENALKVNTTHGQFYTRFYKTWASMKSRCDNPRSISYKRYGNKGIAYQDSWATFEGFETDMHESYLEHCAIYGEKDTTIDRIDNKKGYTKDNCRWATNLEQQNNKEINKFITFRGETLTFSNMAKKYGFNKTTLWCRVYKHGWDIEKALTTPVRKKEGRIENT